uniref:Cytochrome b561 domain-containing protein n=1 Tax=Compsopogon caeruleus TaxID=31354 RepID=A0A7S1XGV4_9RHOD|mmetsp:Transcript_7534/g.15329  ORF Transcript_7534/g.15329 Transcript_7534/m.15329 type:complete len:218 (+) Transcript_7534:68-721(+)
MQGFVGGWGVCGGLRLSRHGLARCVQRERRSVAVVAPVRMVMDPTHVLSVTPASMMMTAANPEILERAADLFRATPKPIMELGHPVMMGIMIATLGLAGVSLGWKGRLNENKKEGVEQKQFHAKLMSLFTVLAFAGASGGTLSVVLQGGDIWQSTHFQTACLMLGMLVINGLIAGAGFGGNAESRKKGRTFHAWFGAAIVAVVIGHVATGISFLQGN